MPPGQQHPVRLRQVHRDVRAGVAGTDDENVAGAKLARVVVLRRVHRRDARVQVAGEIRDHRHPVEAGGHDDVIRLKPFARGLGDVGLAVVPQPFDGDARADREVEPVGVRLEVVGELLAGGERPGGRRIRHSRQAVVHRGSEQA